MYNFKGVTTQICLVFLCFSIWLHVCLKAQSLFYLNLLETELHSLSLDHLNLPIMHLAETIAHDLSDRRSLSDLYRLR